MNRFENTSTSSFTAPPLEPLGRSDAFLAFMEQLSRAAKVDRPVLIVGERGTGKELAAARLHFLSARWQAPLVTLNCAALSPTLLESELFGHEAGAFTGALSRRPGRFEVANRGTLFLDEIGNTPLTAQEKILRAVEYGSFERVGGSRPVEVDVRIVGATNKDLRAQVREGSFKSDLLDRLSFDVLMVPPLRYRHGDIMLLAGHFAARMSSELGIEQPPLFTDQVREDLLAHPWPGNVRELKNVIERAVYRSDGDMVKEVIFDPFPSLEDTPAITHPKTKSQPAVKQYRGPGPWDLKHELEELERSLLKKALTSGRYNQKEAARLLGLSYHQLRGLLRKHGGPARLLEKDS